MANEKVTIQLNAQDNATQTINKVNKSIGGLSGTVKMVGGAMAGLLTIQTAKMTYELAKAGAQAQELEKSYEKMVTSFGGNSDKILRDMKKMSNGTVSETKQMKLANQAMLLMGEGSLDKLPKMMEIARASAKATGESTEFMFESMVTGMGRQSKMILDNLGIIVDVDQANKKYAQSIGKTASQLTEAEKKQAFFNATMEAGEDTIKRVGGGVDSNIESFLKLETAVIDLGVTLGQFLTRILKPTITGLTFAASAISNLLKGNFKEAGKDYLDGMKGFYTELLNMYIGGNEQAEESFKQLVKKAQETTNVLNETEEQKAKKAKDAADLQFNLEQSRLSQSANFFANMAEVAKSGGEQTLNIVKGLSIAETIISTIAAAQAANKSAIEIFPAPAGAIIGAVMAAAQVAVGMARVAQIASTSTSSTSVSNVGGGGAVSVPSAPTPTSSFNTGGSVASTNNRNSGAVLNINVTGAQFMSAGDFKTAINEIIQNAKSQGYDIQKLDTVGVVQ